jgi:2-methylisocitrate lyase-like PEP mutase family enzyme
MRSTARLRQLLRESGVIVAPGAYDALSALIIQREGFPAVYLTGAGVTGGLLGLTDVGLITMSEIVQVARNVALAVDVPVVSDADTGFGNPINTRRTVREFERAGVAGIHIEDQVWPKRCGHFEGKALIPIIDMQYKIRAACDARENSDFVIIARCDAIAVEGFEAALARGQAYVEAGADMLFIESPRTVEEVEQIAHHFRDQIPLFFNMAETGKTPYIPAQTLGEMGYKMVIYSAPARLAAAKGITEVMRELKRTGSTAGAKDKMISFSEWTELTGLPEVQALEGQYGGDPGRIPSFKTGEFEPSKNLKS